MKQLLPFLIIMIVYGLFTLTACDPSFDDFICQKGVIKLVPSDNHSGSEVASRSDYVCGVSFSDESNYNEKRAIHYASNGSFQPYYQYKDGNVEPMCTWLPSDNRGNVRPYAIHECGYNDCPDCVVVYCNSKDELTLSHKTCADFINNKDESFTP